jgi:hypothetical protein
MLYIQINRWRADFANSNKGDLFVSEYMLTPRQKLSTANFVDTKHRVYYTRKGKKRKKHSKRFPGTQFIIPTTLQWAPKHISGQQTVLMRKKNL